MLHGYIAVLWLSTWFVPCELLTRCPTNVCSRQTGAIIFPPYNNNATGRHLYIAGVLPLRKRGKDVYSLECGEVDAVMLLRLRAFEWALRTVSDRLKSKPEITIGGVAFDSCNNVFQSIEEVSAFEMCRLAVKTADKKSYIDRRFIASYMDFHTNLTALQNARMEGSLLRFGKPVMRLMHSTRFQSGLYFRSGPVDQQMNALVNIITSVENVQHYAMVLYSHGELYENLYEKFMMASSHASVCVPYKRRLFSLEAEMERVVQDIRKNRHFRFLVLLLTDYDLEMLLGEMAKGTGKESIAFSVILMVPDLSPAYKGLLQKSRLGSVLLEYTHTLSNSQGHVINTFSENYRGLVKDSEIPAGLSADDVVANVADVVLGVDILVAGLEGARRRLCNGDDVCDELMEWDSNMTRVRESVRDATPYGDEKAFNNMNYIPTEYKILEIEPRRNVSKRAFVQVGIVKKDGNVTMTGDGVRAFNEDNKSLPPNSSCPPQQEFICKQVCSEAPPTTHSAPTEPPPESDQYTRYENTPIKRNMAMGYHMQGGLITQKRSSNEYGDRYSEYRQTWSIAIAVCAGVGMVIVIVLEIIILYRALKTRKSDKPPYVFMKFRTLFSGQLLLLSIFLSYFTLIAFIFVPTAATCGIIRFCVGFCYATMFSLLIVKLLVLLKSRTSEFYLPGEEKSPNYLRGELQLIIFFAALAVQIAIGAQWLIQVPPRSVLALSYGDEPVWICNHYTWSVGNNFWDMSTFVRSNSVNHIISLVYISFLIVVALVLALQAQDIVTNLRESRFILFAILFTLPVWIAWQLLAGLIHDYKRAYAHEIADASTAFGLFLIATIILFTMFLPKSRQLISAGLEGVYLEDDKDTKYYDSASVLSPRDIANGSSYFVAADGSIVDGNMSTLSRPRYVETSFSTALPDRSIHDRSAFSTLDRHRAVYDGASTLTRPYATSTLGRTKEPNVLYSETHSTYENDPHALHAKHPKTTPTYGSTPNLTVIPPAGTLPRASSTLNRSMDTGQSGGRNRALLLSHDLTGRRAHAGMYPSYSSDIGSPTSASQFNYGKRSKSSQGQIGSL